MKCRIDFRLPNFYVNFLMMNARHLIDVTYMFESVHRFCFEENEQRREEEPRAGLAYDYFREI